MGTADCTTRDCRTAARGSKHRETMRSDRGFSSPRHGSLGSPAYPEDTAKAPQKPLTPRQKRTRRKKNVQNLGVTPQEAPWVRRDDFGEITLSQCLTLFSGSQVRLQSKIRPLAQPALLNFGDSKPTLSFPSWSGTVPSFFLSSTTRNLQSCAHVLSIQTEA